MPAATDCELIRAGFLAQPINAATSLSFVLVGALLIRSRPVLGVLSCCVGFGSFVFHGPMPDWAEWAHDLTLAMLLVRLVWEARLMLVGLVGVAMGVGLALFLEAAELATLVLAGIAGIVLTRRYLADPRRSHLLAVGALAVGGVLLVLSRTGGPLCLPESAWQGHGVWHLLAATALWLWARTAMVPGHGIP